MTRLILYRAGVAVFGCFFLATMGTLAAQEAAPQAAVRTTGPSGGASRGIGDAGMMGPGMGAYGGGYGGDYGGGMGSPSLKFVVLEGETEAGNERLKVRTASRVKRFAYQLSSLKPQETDSGYGGGMMGGYGSEGFDGDSGGYGGEMMSGYGPLAGSNAMQSPRQRTIEIFAYIFDQEQENYRTKIELLTPPPPGTLDAKAPGHGIEEGMGMMGSVAEIPQFVRLADLVGPTGTSSREHQLTPTEFTIVGNTIKLKLWKADAVEQLNAQQGNAAETEQLLKQLLTEEYETQLTRQEAEVDTIQQRITQLKDEIARRRNAKARVIDVQLGRIVLEAQGLLAK